MFIRRLLSQVTQALDGCLWTVVHHLEREAGSALLAEGTSHPASWELGLWEVLSFLLLMLYLCRPGLTLPISFLPVLMSRVGQGSCAKAAGAPGFLRSDAAAE